MFRSICGSYPVVGKACVNIVNPQGGLIGIVFRLKLLIVLVSNGAYLDVCKRAAALVASTGPWFSLCVA